MSYDAQKWAWKISSTLNSSTEVVVLVLLADMANDENDCWPSIPFISEKTRVTRKTVFKVLESLVNMGLIIRKPQPGLATHYILNVGATRSNFTTSSKKTTTPVVNLPLGSSNFTTTPVVILPPEPIKNLNITSNKEPEIYTPPKTKRQKQVFEKPDDIPQELFDRIVQYRKDIQKPFKTQNGLDRIISQIRKAKDATGASYEEIVDFWTAKEWQGFEAEWFIKTRQNTNSRFSEPQSVSHVTTVPKFTKQDHLTYEEADKIIRTKKMKRMAQQ